MLGLLWVIVSLVLAIVLRDRLRLQVLLILSIWALLPGIAATTFALGRIGMHPAGLLTIWVFLVQLCTRGRRLGRVLERQPGTTLALAAIAVLTPVTTFVITTASERAIFGVQMVSAPIITYWLVGAALSEHPDFLTTLRNWFLTFAVGESLLALAQATTHTTILYSKYFARQYWFRPNFQRWMGTLDHPLLLSLFLTLALPLAATLRSAPLRLLVVLAVMAGLIVTQARTGLVVGSLELLYLALRSRGGFFSRLVLFAPLAAGFVIAARSSLVAGALARFTESDNGSAAARTDSLHWFLQNAGNTWWLGDGMEASFAQAASAGFGTSFEMSFIMYAIDIGLVMSILYFGAMVLCAVLAARPGGSRGLGVAALAGLIVPETFSALGTVSAAAPLLWTILAMAAFQVRGRRSTAPAAVRTGHPTGPRVPRQPGATSRPTGIIA